MLRCVRAHVVVVCWLVGCYNPAAPAGAPCSLSGTCPDDQVCVATVCVAPGQSPDAGSDGAGGGDKDGDGVPDVSDNCVDVKNADQANEDGDAFGDACDLCPQIADSAAIDGDGDGIGDACDPNPTTGDAVVLFEGFHGSGLPPWGGTAAWSNIGDKLEVRATGNATDNGEFLDPPITSVGRALDKFSVAITVAVFQSVGGEHEIGVSVFDNRLQRSLYCELQQGASAAERAVVIEDDNDNAPLRKALAFAWLEGVEYRLTFMRQGTSYTCTAVGPDGVHAIAASSPVVPSLVEVGAFGMTGQIGSVFAVGPP
jgi:hypothetical protein